MVKYQINEKADKNEEEVEKEVVEEEVGQETDTVPEEDANDEKTWWTRDQTHEGKIHIFEMKTIERRKGQLLKYKIVNYRVNERPDKNEKEVVEELVQEEMGQEGGNDEHGDEKDAGN